MSVRVKNVTLHSDTRILGRKSRSRLPRTRHPEFVPDETGVPYMPLQTFIMSDSVDPHRQR